METKNRIPGGISVMLCCFYLRYEFNGVFICCTKLRMQDTFLNDNSNYIIVFVWHLDVCNIMKSGTSIERPICKIMISVVVLCRIWNALMHSPQRMHLWPLTS